MQEYNTISGGCEFDYYPGRDKIVHIIVNEVTGPCLDLECDQYNFKNMENCICQPY
jgi:hypothetical protein